MERHRRMKDIMNGKLLAGLLFALLAAGCSGKKDEKKDDARVMDKDEGPSREKPADKDNKPANKDGKPADKDDQPPIDNSPAPRITGEKIGSEFRADVTAATAKYHGKVFELKSTIEEMGLSTAGEAYLSLAGALEPTLSLIECYVKDKEPWNRAVPGQMATLRGRCEILGGELKFRECQILDVNGPKAIAVKAADLAQQYEKDEAGAAKMYENKWLEVAGEMGTDEPAEAFGKTVFKLKVPGKVSITCSAEGGMAAQAKRLKPGQQVKLIGKQRPYSAAEGIDLVSCILLAKP